MMQPRTLSEIQGPIRGRRRFVPGYGGNGSTDNGAFSNDKVIPSGRGGSSHPGWLRSDDRSMVPVVIWTLGLGYKNSFPDTNE
jgi:hypothetical protein